MSVNTLKKERCSSFCWKFLEYWLIIFCTPPYFKLGSFCRPPTWTSQSETSSSLTNQSGCRFHWTNQMTVPPGIKADVLPVTVSQRQKIIITAQHVVCWSPSLLGRIMLTQWSLLHFKLVADSMPKWWVSTTVSMTVIVRHWWCHTYVNFSKCRKI